MDYSQKYVDKSTCAFFNLVFLKFQINVKHVSTTLMYHFPGMYFK